MNIFETDGAHFVETPFNSLLRLRRSGDASAYVVAELRQVFVGVRFHQAFAGYPVYSTHLCYALETALPAQGFAAGEKFGEVARVSTWRHNLLLCVFSREHLNCEVCLSIDHSFL